MHGDIGQYHNVFRFVECPAMIGFQDKLGSIVQGAVAGSDDVNGVALHLLQVLLDNSSEGHHDFRIIPLGSFVDLSSIPDIQIGCSQVGAEEITGEEYLVFLQVSKHCLRPVNPRGIDKLQRSIPQRNGLFIVDRYKLRFWNHEQVDKYVLTLGCTYHFRFRVFLQHLRDSTGMVLLGVIGNHVIYSFNSEFTQVIYQPGDLSTRPAL